MGTRTTPTTAVPKTVQAFGWSWRGLWTSDPSLGAHWSRWGPAHYAFSLFVSVFLSLCLYLSIFSLCISTSSFLSLCLCIPLNLSLCVSLPVSLFLSTSLCLCVSPFLLPTLWPHSTPEVCEQGPGSAFCGRRGHPGHLHHRRCPTPSDQVG